MANIIQLTCFGKP